LRWPGSRRRRRPEPSQPVSPSPPPRGRRLLIDYHERILASSTSVDRRDRSQRALDRLRREQVEEDERLRRIESALPPAATFDGRLQRWRDALADDADLEVVWDGARGRAGASLSSWR
jgi:hypothetical protein